MKRLILALSLLAVASAPLLAETRKADLAILAETRADIMPGMEVPEGFDPEMLKGFPGMADIPGLSGLFGPKRSLEILLSSPGKAPSDAYARVTAPASFKKGPVLNLEIEKPGKPVPWESGTDEAENRMPDKQKEFVIKRYWGSSQTVRQGQPEVIKWSTLNQQMQGQIQAAVAKAKLFGELAEPDNTRAYWPNKPDDYNIAKDASLAGEWKLDTNYCGTASLIAPTDVTFLAPFEFSGALKSGDIDLNSAITINWKAIPGLLASEAGAMGMEGENTLILWSSSEKKTDNWMGGGMGGFITAAEAQAGVKDGTLIAPDKTTVFIPAGIFKNCDMATLTMTGYGKGAASTGDKVNARIQTKTVATVMLGGNMMFEDQ